GDLTQSCAVSAAGDMWTAGYFSNVVSHLSVPSNGSPAQLLGSIDVRSYTTTAACGTVPGNPRAGCGAAASVAVDRAGHVFVGTSNGRSRVLEFDAGGTLLDSFALPAGPLGVDQMDLAADQTTMFYTSHDGRIRVFRLDRTPIPAVLRLAGLCVKGSYRAAVTQPDCAATPGHPLCAPTPECGNNPGFEEPCRPYGTPAIETVADRTNAEGEQISLPINAASPVGAPLTYF